MIASAPIPSAASVRMIANLVTAAFAAPLVVTIGLLAAHAVSSDPLPLELFCVFLLLGTVSPIVHHLRGRRRVHRRIQRRGHRGAVDPETRQAVLAIAPELTHMTMLVGGPDMDAKIRGRRLLIGVGLMGPERPGTLASDRRLFAVTHEARHHAVAAKVLGCFRLIRAAQVSAAASVYTSIILGVVTIFDGPYRAVLTIGLVVLPYLVGTLNAVLDIATRALEWLLEYDADVAAAERCRVEGRPEGIPPVEWRHPTLDRDDVHGPSSLRLHSLRGNSPRRAVCLVLVSGWFATVIPVSTMVVFASITVRHPDLCNSLLAAALATNVLAAGAAVFAASRPGPPEFPLGLRKAASAVWLRTYIIAMRVLGWIASTLAVFLLAILAKHIWLRERPPLLDLASLLICIAIALSYFKAGSARLAIGWIIGNAVTDALRLWLMVWFIRATGALPFYDDLPALSTAMYGHVEIIGRELSRIWSMERGWLIGAAAACSLASVSVALLAVMAKRLLIPKQRSIVAA